MISGVLFRNAVMMLPMPLPVPAEVCKFTSAGWRVACANPSAIATTEASCKPRMYWKSSGKFFKNGCSVEPGLPNMVVSFKALSRSYVAAHTVGTLSVVIAALLVSN
jgi:hypothetical protein